MDTIITLLIIFSVLTKIFGKGKKKQEKQIKKTRNLESLFENVAEYFQEETPAPAKPAPAKPAPAANQYMEGSGSAPAFRSQLGDHSTEGKSRYGTAPLGSMMDSSTEGMDICDPTLGHDDHSTGCDVHDVMLPLDNMDLGEGAGLDLDWNSEGMVKAFIMDNLRILIADDDPGMRLVLRKIIGKVEGFNLIGEAENGKEALEMADTLRPDILFLDVEMPEMTGLECARVVQDMNPSTIIIFATAHDTYMGDAFELYAFDYMVKPFKVERVVQTLERAREVLSRRQPMQEAPKPAVGPVVKGRMMLHHRGGISFIDINDVLLVQREERSTVLYTADGGRYVTSDSLSDMEERLPQDVFFRCHKSYIINLNHIKDISPYGRWTYVVRLEGIKQDALITHEKYEELENMFR